MPISDAAITAAAIEDIASPRPARASSGGTCDLIATTFIGEGMATRRGAIMSGAADSHCGFTRSEEKGKLGRSPDSDGPLDPPDVATSFLAITRTRSAPPLISGLWATLMRVIFNRLRLSLMSL